MRSLFLVFGFYSVIIAITFSLKNAFGLLLMTFLALVVLPPFVQVGVFTTTGFRRAFFIGAACSGIPHFLLAVFVVIDGLSGDFARVNGWFSNDDTSALLLIYHLVGIGLASIGGLSGFVSYGLLHGFRSSKTSLSPAEIGSKQAG